MSLSALFILLLYGSLLFLVVFFFLLHTSRQLLQHKGHHMTRANQPSFSDPSTAVAPSAPPCLSRLPQPCFRERRSWLATDTHTQTYKRTGRHGRQAPTPPPPPPASCPASGGGGGGGSTSADGLARLARLCSASTAVSQARRTWRSGGRWRQTRRAC